MKRYFGIKTPKTKYDEPYIYWLSTSEHNSWILFFGDKYTHGSNDESRRAYEAIGYKCVELEIKEKG